jgi:hypothetical protein
MLHALHHAMSDGLDRREDRLLLKPVEQKSHRHSVVGASNAAGGLPSRGWIVDNQSSAARTNAIDLPA